MHNLKLTLSYDGTYLLGWQKTKEGPSVEEALEKALQQILRQEISLQAASRTDAGVHAENQIVNCIVSELPDLPLLQKGLNGLLPKEIRVKTIEEKDKSFHPTLDCIGKRYDYKICSGPIQLPFHRHVSWHFPPLLDLDKMQTAAALLLGTHDFSAFCNYRNLWTRSPVCTLEKILFTPFDRHRLSIQIEGDHFLYKMVRNLVGTLAYIGCERIHIEDLKEALFNKDRTKTGVTAPAHGLILTEVFYT